MAINIGYEPAGLSALAALVLGEAARADAEQRRGEAQGGANMQTALAALNANADRGAGNMLARGYSGGQLINLGGGGGGGSAEGTSVRIAREIGGVNSTPQERAGIQADILAGRDPNGTGGGSRRSGGNGAAPISSVQGSLAEAQAYDFDRTPQSVRRALYSPEDAASIDRIQTQVGGYQDLERLQQEGRVEIQGLISDRQNMKMGMPTRADEVRRAQLNSQIRQLEMDDTVPDDVKAPAIQHLQNEAKKIPTSAPLDWQNDIERDVKFVPGLGVLIRKNSNLQFDRSATNAMFKNQENSQKPVADSEVTKATKAVSDRLEKQRMDLADEIETLTNNAEEASLKASSAEKKGNVSEARRLEAERAEIAKKVREARARFRSMKEAPDEPSIREEIRKMRELKQELNKGLGLSGDPNQSADQADAVPDTQFTQQALQIEQQLKSKAGAAWPQVEADIKSLSDRFNAETDPKKKEDARAALMFYMVQLNNGVVPNAP